MSEDLEILGASVDGAGSCCCPKCSTCLCLVPCEKKDGAVADVVDLLGKSSAKVYASDKSCACFCPRCGTPIALSLAAHDTVDGSGVEIMGASPKKGGFLSRLWHALTHHSHEVVLGDGASTWVVGAKGKKPWPPAAQVKKQMLLHKPQALPQPGYVAKAAVRFKSALAKTQQAGQNAVNVASRLSASVSKYKKQDHKSLVHGQQVVLGVGLTPKQNAAVQKHIAAMIRHAAIARQASLMVPMIKKAGQAAIDASKGRHTVLGGVGYALLGADAAGKNPGDPGYDPSTDPNDTTGAYAAAHQGADAGAGVSGAPTWDQQTGVVTTASGEEIYPGYAKDPNGYGVTPSTTVAQFVSVPEGVISTPDGSVYYDPSNPPNQVTVPDPPPQRGLPLSKDDALVRFTSGQLPNGFVPYPGRWPRGGDRAIGSWSFFYGPQYFGQGGGGQYGMGWRQGFANNGWIRHYGVTFGGGLNVDAHPDWGDADAFKQAGADNGVITTSQYPTLPLIGNPKDPQTAGLQYDEVGDGWFWQAQHAPASVTAAQDSVLRDQITKANNANAAAANKAASEARDQLQTWINSAKKTVIADAVAIYGTALQAAKDAADFAEQQAKQQAQEALAQEAATSAAQTANITAQQQQQAQQAQLDLQAQQMQLDQMKQQSDLDYQAQQQYLQDQAQQSFDDGSQQFDDGSQDYGAPDYGDSGGGAGSGDFQYDQYDQPVPDNSVDWRDQ